MKLNLRQQITQFAHVLQSELFPRLEEELGDLINPLGKALGGSFGNDAAGAFRAHGARMGRPAS